MNNQSVCQVFTNYSETVSQCMKTAGAEEILSEGRPVMLKPNLINDSPHPVTTPPAFCEAVIEFTRAHTDAPIVIAEGCGDSNLDTPEVFERLGYHALVRRLGVELLDLNPAPLVKLQDDHCLVFPEIWLPQAVFDHVLISLPVLKAHSMCRLTGSMKNMIGLAPPKHYSGRFGSWKKAAFHQNLDQAIIDLNRYRRPDFTVMDATIGLPDFHLGGSACGRSSGDELAGYRSSQINRSQDRT